MGALIANDFMFAGSSSGVIVARTLFCGLDPLILSQEWVDEFRCILRITGADPLLLCDNPTKSLQLNLFQRMIFPLIQPVRQAVGSDKML
jgi:hypothetical protein